MRPTGSSKKKQVAEKKQSKATKERINKSEEPIVDGNSPEIEEVNNENDLVDQETAETEVSENITETDEPEEVITEIVDEKAEIDELKKLGLSDKDLRDAPKQPFDPYTDNVIKRDYTQGGQVNSGGNTVQQEEDVPRQNFAEPIYTNPNEPISSDDENPNEIISGGGSSNGGGEQSSTYNDDDTESYADEPEQPKMSDKELRKNAKKTAEVLLTTWQNVFPIPFKMLAKYNEGKLNNMEISDEINMEKVVLNDGTTIRMHVKQHNAECDQLLEYTDEHKQEIEEPLIDVLMEKGAILSPVQRLLIAVGGQVVAFSMAAFNLNQTKRSALAQFKEFHEDDKAKDKRPVKSASEKVNEPQEQQSNQSQNKSETEYVKSEDEEVVNMESYINENDPSVTIETIEPETE